MDEDSQRNYYDILTATPEPSNDRALDVLLQAIDNPPMSSTDSFPTLAAFLANPPHDNNPCAVPGAGMSIDSLLAASQQLAAPDRRQPAPSRGSAWGPTPTERFGAGVEEDDLVKQLQQFVDEQGEGVGAGVGVGREVVVQPDLERVGEGSGRAAEVEEPKKKKGRRRKTSTAVQERVRDGPVVMASPPLPVIPVPGVGMGGPAESSAVGEKREWEEAGIEERRDKIRRSIQSSGIGMSGRTETSATSLTTLLCLHASAAQKSYGIEKRYLCPPPMVRIEGPMKSLASKPRLSMSVVSEAKERTAQERATIAEPHMRAFFRGLHVSAPAKSKVKSFSLDLSLHSPPPPSTIHTELQQRALESHPSGVDLAPAFASFASANITIISKPSKKTIKARDTTSCIFAGSTICLHTRVNSQTVRTKYMAIDEGELCPRQSQWTAFSIHVLRRAGESLPDADERRGPNKARYAANTVTYGSEILLTDLMTGVSSEPLVVRKVEKKRVVLDADGPVSQLQKLAFSRVSDGRAMYLSAAPDGMDSKGNEVKQSEEGVKETGRKRKREEDVEDDDKPLKLVLTYQYPIAVHPAIEGGDAESYDVDDLMTWTVTGINSFSYSFFDAFAGTQFSLPTAPITPFPTVSAPPEYHGATHSLSFTVSHFFSTPPGLTHAVPLEIWVGPLGPLKVHVIQPSGVVSGQDLDLVGPQVTDDDPDGALAPNQSFISVELPPITEMVEAASRNAVAHSTFEELLAGTQAHFPPDDSYLDERSLAAFAESINAPAAASSSSQLVVDLDLPTHPSAPRPDSRAFEPTVTPAPDLSLPSLPPLPLPRPVSLPLIFMRPSDGVGYMSSRWVVAEQVQPDGTDTVAALLAIHPGSTAPWMIRIV